MRKVYVVAIKNDRGEATIVCISTNQTNAWKLREELLSEGHRVVTETVPLNEDVHIVLNTWVTEKRTESI